jgi:hypothetical protein
MARRTKLPKAVETAVLTKSARRCCLCCALHGDYAVKEGQVAHLDDDPSNNNLDNLAWLCVFHHAQWHTRSSMTKGFTAEEVKYRRAQLYSAIENRTLPHDDQDERRVTRRDRAFNTTTGDKSTVINAARDVNYNPRITRKIVVQPGPEHVSSEQALEIRTRIVELAELEAKSGGKLNPGKWYNKLYEAFGVTSYLLTPAEHYADVIVWLQRQAALLRPKLRRTNNPEWRNSLYKGIWARARQVGMGKEEVHAFAGSVVGMDAAPESLSDLGERSLKQVHDALFRHTRG